VQAHAFTACETENDANAVRSPNDIPGVIMKSVFALALLASLVAGCASRPEIYAESRSYSPGEYRTDAYPRAYRSYDGDIYVYHEYHSMGHRSGQGDAFREHGN
jgi:hypothetical protein